MMKVDALEKKIREHIKQNKEAMGNKTNNIKKLKVERKDRNRYLRKRTK